MTPIASAGLQGAHPNEEPRKQRAEVAEEVDTRHHRDDEEVQQRNNYSSIL